MATTVSNEKAAPAVEVLSPRVAEWAGALVALVGLAVLAGWVFGLRRIVQLDSTLVPMQFNTALGLLLCGAAYAVRTRTPRFAGGAAAGALAIGLATTLQYAAAIDLGIDQLLFVHEVTVKSSSPGRMAPTTAGVLAASGVSLLLSLSGARKRASSWIALSGATVLAIGVGTLFGYGAGFQIPYGWERASYMALHTAVASGLLGSAALDVALRDGRENGEAVPRWLPWCAGWLVLALTIGLAHALWARERALFERTSTTHAAAAADEATEAVEEVRRRLERVAKRLATPRGSLPTGHVEQEAKLHVIHGAPAAAVLRVSEQGVEWLASREKPDAAAERALAALAVNGDREEVRRAMIPFGSGKRGLAILVPLEGADFGVGFLAAVLDAPSLVRRVSEQTRILGYTVELLEGSRVVFREADVRSTSREGRTVGLPIVGADLSLRITPDSEVLASVSTALPAGVLGGGGLVAILLGLVTHLVRVSDSRERTLERAADELSVEVEERRRAEAALREHRAQLKRTVCERTRELREANALLRAENVERWKAETDAHVRADQLTVIHELVRVITASADVREIYRNLMTLLTRLVPFDASTLLVLDDAREWLWIEAEWDGDGLVPGDGSRLRVSASAVWPMLRDPKPRVERVPAGALDGARRTDIQTVLYLPLETKDAPQGFLTLQSRDAGAYTSEIVEVLTPIASQLAIALLNARLYQASQIYASELERRVAERTDELERAVRDLEAFSYSVSHDLRAPLRHVSGFVDLLSRHAGSGLDETSRRYLTIIGGATKRMGTLIDGLLGFSRIGRHELEFDRIDLDELLAEVVAELAPEIEGRSVDLELGDLPTVRGDRTLLGVVVSNVLSNALKFSRNRKPARIQVGAELSEEEIVVFVRDNGVGFDERYRDKLFQVFQRLHRAEDFEGTGIGLANASRIVQRHGGRMWAASRLGEGATFFFGLPKTPQEVSVEPQTHSSSRG